MLILLLTATGGVYLKTDFVSKYIPQLAEVKPLAQSLWAKINFSSEEPEEISPMAMDLTPIELELPAVEPKTVVSKPAIQPQAGEALQYIRVGNCMSVECRTQLVGEVELLGLPSVLKKYRKKTVYYELISKERYKKSTAESKLVDIEQHALAAPPAALRHSRGLWQVSLGEFPDQRQGVYMKSYLAQLYPDIDIPLKLIAKRRHFDVEYIYAGPFTSRFNAESVVELLRDKRFVQETWITTKP